MIDLVKWLLVPGSLPFLALGLVAGVAWLYAGPRGKWWARAWLTALLAAYAVFAMPIGADLLRRPLVRGYLPISSADREKGIDTLVVLSTGGEVYRAYGWEVAEMGRSTSYNAMEAARLYRLLAPAHVIVSDGIVDPGSRTQTEAEVLAAALVHLGVARNRIVLEPDSRSTHEQAVNVAGLLKARDTRRFLLVTNASHMPRAEASFRQLDLDPVPCVAGLAGDGEAGGIWRRFVPSLNALDESSAAIYEYLAGVYYAVKGWTR
jgi:uncharacterized SAM-binding protein YcdF (DUF218 family)